MPKLIMTRGLPASGKSTWAMNEVAQGKGKVKAVSKDDLRRMLDGGQWSKENEKFVLMIRDCIVKRALSEGYDIIVHDTNLAEQHAERLEDLANMYVADFKINDRFLDVPMHVCLERDRKRGDKSVGDKVIQEMWRKYLRPNYEYDESKPSVCVSDLDGSFCLLNGRNPYDASTCDQDLMNPVVFGILRDYYRSGAEIIFVSGRYDTHQPQTEKWLRENWGDSTGPWPYKLYMRRADDTRKDSIIKREIYEQHILPYYNVLNHIDDRPQVIRMVRYELGLPVIDVGEGLEF